MSGNIVIAGDVIFAGIDEEDITEVPNSFVVQFNYSVKRIL